MESKPMNLYRNRGENRQFDTNGSAFKPIFRDFDVSLMILDDAVTDGQPESGSAAHIF